MLTAALVGAAVEEPVADEPEPEPSPDVVVASPELVALLADLERVAELRVVLRLALAPVIPADAGAVPER